MSSNTGDEEITLPRDSALSSDLRSYLPREFPERKHEIEKLAGALNPATKGSKQNNVEVTGPAGQGKTATVMMLTEAIRQHHDVTPLYVDCSECTVDTDVWIRLLERAQLLQHQYLPLRTAANSKRSVINQFEQTANDINGVLIVILDDLDLEASVNNLLYGLSRFDVVGVELGTIVISENPEFRSDASNATLSSWSPTRVKFARYGESDLVSILHRRLEALNDGNNAVPVQTVESIAKQVVDEFGGSARAAIDILQNTCPSKNTAEEALANRLDDSITTYRNQRLMAEISQADRPSKTVLVAVLHAVTAANDESPTINTIYSTYCDITEAASVRQFSEATFHEELNEWTTTSVIEKTANGIALCLEPDLVNQAVTQEGGPQLEVDPTAVE